MRILVRSTFKKFESMSFEGVEREERRDQAFSNFPEPTYWSHAVSHGNHVSVTMFLLTIYKQPCSCMPLFTRVEPAEEDHRLNRSRILSLWSGQSKECCVLSSSSNSICISVCRTISGTVHACIHVVIYVRILLLIMAPPESDTPPYCCSIKCTPTATTSADYLIPALARLRIILVNANKHLLDLEPPRLQWTLRNRSFLAQLLLVRSLLRDGRSGRLGSQGMYQWCSRAWALWRCRFQGSRVSR